MRTQALPLQLILFLADLFPASTLAFSWRGNRCPDAIQTRIPGYSRPGEKAPDFSTMALVHDSLQYCANITSLDLRVSLLGCSGWPDRWNFPFKLEGGDPYAPLKHLRLEGYRFEDKEWDAVQFSNLYSGLPWYERALEWVYRGHARKYMKYRTLDRPQREKTNVQLWLDAMDWSQLESLALLDDHAPLELVSHLRSLRKLELSSTNTTAQLQFITGLEQNSLRHLTLTTRPLPSLPHILNHHGESLEHIEIRAPEIMSEASPTYNVSELELLASRVPNLAHLGVTMPRHGEQLLETLDRISSMASLRSADFWFDMTSECRRQIPEPGGPRLDGEVYKESTLAKEACEGEDFYARPFIGDEFALEMFRHIRSWPNGVHVDNATFWVGDWSRGWDGPLYFPDWLEGRRSKVRCSAQGKTEGQAWCVVEEGKEYWTKTGCV